MKSKICTRGCFREHSLIKRNPFNFYNNLWLSFANIDYHIKATENFKPHFNIGTEIKNHLKLFETRLSFVSKFHTYELFIFIVHESVCCFCYKPGESNWQLPHMMLSVFFISDITFSRNSLEHCSIAGTAYNFWFL